MDEDRIATKAGRRQRPLYMHFDDDSSGREVREAESRVRDACCSAGLRPVSVLTRPDPLRDTDPLAALRRLRPESA
jgi:hypothetical protein